MKRNSCPVAGCGRSVAGVHRYGRAVNKRILFSMEQKFAQVTGRMLKAAEDRRRAAMEAFKVVEAKAGW